VTCAEIFEDVFKRLVRLQVGMLGTPQSQVFRTEIKAGLERSQSRAAKGVNSVNRDQVQDSMFAIAALADEIGRRACAAKSLNGEWRDASNRDLVQELFHDVTAGNEFYKRLEKWRANRNRAAAEVLEVYLLCLLLGYRGEQTDDAKRTKFIGDLLRDLREFGGEPPSLHLGDDELRKAPALLAPISSASLIPAWAMRVGTAVICAAFAGLYIHHYWFRSDSVVNRLGELAGK